MKVTEEQQIIIDHVKSTPGLTMVSAVAGSGKTTLLTKIAQSLNPTIGLYLAYNKSVATEAQSKFPNTISCLTTHSLAYRAVHEAGYKLKIESRITYRLLPSNINYQDRCAIIAAIDHFCVSEYLCFTKFAKNHTLLPKAAIVAGEKLLGAMSEGKAICSHGFYLKLYHILLADGDIEYDPFDFIALDEAGDINLVTLEIFKLLPARSKIMVGDPHQNIYNFNRTVNCFAIMQDKGTLYPLSQSFRVSKDIADKIQHFCTKYLHEDMSFKGVEVDAKSIKDEAYIARTNTSLIAKMMELNELDIPYNLTRDPDTLFKIHKMLCYLKPRSYISIPEYSFLQKDVDAYYASPTLRKMYKTHLVYLMRLHKDDKTLSNAIQTIFQYSVPAILECYNKAKKYKTSRKKYSITLGTAHSTKGLEFDKVVLAPDMNSAISDSIQDIRRGATSPEFLTIEQRTELNLYYVACSRARKQLENAVYL